MAQTGGDMETDKIIKEMENRGYTVSDESGVLMITGRTLNLDEAMSQIRKDLDELDFHGSWGTKGYPKGKVPKGVTLPAAKEPVQTAYSDDDDEAEEMAGSEDVIEASAAAESDGAAEESPAGAASGRVHADAHTAETAEETEPSSPDESDESLDDDFDDADDSFDRFDHIPDVSDFDSDDFGQMSFNFL